MTAEQFRVALRELGFSPAGFTLWLRDRGWQVLGPDKTVKIWCANGPPGAVEVIVSQQRELEQLRLSAAAMGVPERMVG